MTTGPIQTTYSFKDLVGTITNGVLSGPLQVVGGFIGNGAIRIRMLTERTEHLVGADGTIMPSYISGNNGEIELEVQQTSQLHHELLSLYNQLLTSADAGDVSNWANIQMSFRTVLDGAVHNLLGCAFRKIGDKPYEARGQNVIWAFLAGYVSNQ